VKDNLGSTRAVVDEAGDVVEAYDYYPFGLQSRSYKEKGDPLTKETFTGKEQDTESNLHYFGARYYDAGAGRWLSVDPLAPIYPRQSPYNYVYNNPNIFVDRYGLEGDEFWNSFRAEYDAEWDAVWSPANGELPGWETWAGSARSYLEGYKSPDGGYYEKQEYGWNPNPENDPYGFDLLGVDYFWIGPQYAFFGLIQDGEYNREYYEDLLVIDIQYGRPIIPATGTPPLVGGKGLGALKYLGRLLKLKKIKGGFLFGKNMNRIQFHRHPLKIMAEGKHIRLGHMNINNLHIFHPFQRYWKVTKSYFRLWYWYRKFP
jgi:RHS repeat-associated protein